MKSTRDYIPRYYADVDIAVVIGNYIDRQYLEISQYLGQTYRCFATLDDRNESLLTPEGVFIDDPHLRSIIKKRCGFDIHDGLDTPTFINLAVLYRQVRSGTYSRERILSFFNGLTKVLSGILPFRADLDEKKFILYYGDYGYTQTIGRDSIVQVLLDILPIGYSITYDYSTRNTCEIIKHYTCGHILDPANKNQQVGHVLYSTYYK